MASTPERRALRVDGLAAKDLLALRRVSAMFSLAEKAREDLVAFFELVMRAEGTGERVRAAAHQRLMFDFLERHERAVLRVPPDHSKTFVLAALVLWQIGREPDWRVGLFGSAQEIPKKVLNLIRRYVDESLELRAVFPDLRRSGRGSDPWTQTAMTVERPTPAKDPTVAAVGYGGTTVVGARMNWAISDDLLTFENTATEESRTKLQVWFENTVNQRILKRPDSKIVFSNQAWHPKDLSFHLQKENRWPTLQMDVFGRIEVWNTGWDHELLVPYEKGSVSCRIRGRARGAPLWPERIGEAEIENLREGRTLDGRNVGRLQSESEFRRVYLHQVRDDATAPCKLEYIEKCKELGRGLRLRTKYEGELLTVTGVDLAVSPGEQSDDTAFFTFLVEPSGHRVILDVEVGKWSGPEIVQKILEKHRRYGSIVRVENNACQDFIRQFVLEADVSVPVRAHTTGRAKAHPEHGLPALFTELENGAWRIPCDEAGRCEPAVQRWIDECLEYVPAKHTGDVLMASYFAREQAKKLGAVRPPSPKGPGAPARAQKRPVAIGASILAR